MSEKIKPDVSESEETNIGYPEFDPGQVISDFQLALIRIMGTFQTLTNEFDNIQRKLNLAFFNSLNNKAKKAYINTLLKQGSSYEEVEKMLNISMDAYRKTDKT
jgi:hypothetical protein